MNEFMRENEAIGDVRAPLEHDTPDTEEKGETKKESTPTESIHTADLVCVNFLIDLCHLHFNDLGTVCS